MSRCSASFVLACLLLPLPAQQAAAPATQTGALAIPEGPGPHELRLPIDADTSKALRERAAARR
jgi:hypothetical protein